MANPQLEDGYTRIPHELLEQFARSPFTGIQRRLVDVVVRHTLGWNRPSAQISFSTFEKDTNIRRTKVSTSLQRLAQMKILHRVSERSGVTPAAWCINQNYEDWNFNPSIPPAGDTSDGIGVPLEGDSSIPPEGDTPVPPEGNSSVPQKGTQLKKRKIGV